VSSESVIDKLDRVDWDDARRSIEADGYARTGSLLDAAACARLIDDYADDSLFRKRIDMERHAFGVGRYGYFASPLPHLVATLRTELYRRLAPIANEMMTAMGRDIRYPPSLATYRRRCHDAGQTKPTPLILEYGPGGYNRLHRDLYGELHFPLQVAVMLSRPGRDYDGGEFLLVENRPRQQSIGSSVTLSRGEAVVFPAYERPVPGKRGTLRAEVRHGVSRIVCGRRFTLGIIFHDAA